jgi:hypothetical protein
MRLCVYVAIKREKEKCRELGDVGGKLFAIIKALTLALALLVYLLLLLL